MPACQRGDKRAKHGPDFTSGQRDRQERPRERWRGDGPSSSSRCGELTSRWSTTSKKGRLSPFEQQTFGGPDTFTGKPYRTRRTGRPTASGVHRLRLLLRRSACRASSLVAGPFELAVHASTFKRAAPYSSYLINRDSDSTHPKLHPRPIAFVISLTSDAVRERAARHAALRRFVRQPVVRQRLGVSGCRYPNAHLLKRDTGIARWIGAEVQGSIDWLRPATSSPHRRGRTLARSDVPAGRVRFDTGLPLRSSEGVIPRARCTLAAYPPADHAALEGALLNAGARTTTTRVLSVISPRVARASRCGRGACQKRCTPRRFARPRGSKRRCDERRDCRDALFGVFARRASIDQRFGAQRISMGAFRSSGATWSSARLESRRAEGSLRPGQDRLFKSIVWSQYRKRGHHRRHGFTGTFEGSVLGDSLRYALNVTGRAPGAAIHPARRSLEVAPRLFGKRGSSTICPTTGRRSASQRSSNRTRSPIVPRRRMATHAHRSRAARAREPRCRVRYGRGSATG